WSRTSGSPSVPCCRWSPVRRVPRQPRPRHARPRPLPEARRRPGRAVARRPPPPHLAHRGVEGLSEGGPRRERTDLAFHIELAGLKARGNLSGYDIATLIKY